MRDALKRLYALGPGRMELGRDRLRRLLGKAGDPHLAVPSVLVGGTNGKGRVVAALSAVLSTKHRTGAFLKPHLKTIRERWRINDEAVDTEMFAHAAHRTCDLIDAHDEPITFFEANVLLGSLLFRDSGCDVAVWEVGLGGKEDACNLTDPLVSILTNVGYDHQAILGDTLPQIAADKALICREGRPLILGPPRPGWEQAYAEYLPVVEAICGREGARLVRLNPQPPELWQQCIKRGAAHMPPDALELSVTALWELARASDERLSVGWEDVNDSLARMHYRGRMERTELNGKPVLLDAAHNVDSLRWLTEVLLTIDPHRRYTVIFGCQQSRDPVDMLAILKPVIGVLVPVEIPVLRPCPLGRVMEAARQLRIPVELPEGITPNAEPAVYTIGGVTELDPPDNSTHWIECVQHGLDLVVDQPAIVCGSIYYMGEILRAFEE